MCITYTTRALGRDWKTFLYIVEGKYTHVKIIIQLFTLTNALLGIRALVLNVMMLLVLLQIDCGAKPGI